MKLNDREFDKSYDIVVVGLGTAGSIALIAAAKRGMKVLGIEVLNAMGGTGTLGAISGYYFGSRGGLYEEVNQEEQELQKDMYIRSSSPRYDTKAYTLEQMALWYGADIRYETRITEVFCKDQTVHGICCFSNGEWLRIESKMLIDCTGEAQICRLAGCPCMTGRKYDGQTQPYSNMAIVMKDNCVYSLNKDSGYVNQNDCKDLSRKIIESTALLTYVRQNSDPMVTFLTNASILGIRQGSTIVGEETVTLEGFLNNERTGKPVFYAYSNVDNHAKDTAFEDDILLDWYVAAGLWEICVSVEIPAGTLLPKDYQGIMVAGRCLSIDHNIASCVRMKSDMEKCGEAAAEIACLAIAQNVPAKEIDYGLLSERLMQTKCLDHSNHVGFAKKIKAHELTGFEWMDDMNEILHELASDRPGIAIWSARMMGEEAVIPLKQCLESSDYLLKKNAAIALGLIGDGDACETLRTMVLTMDAFIPKTSLKYSYMHGVTAIYLLGRLVDIKSVDLLLNLIQPKEKFDCPAFISDDFYTTAEDVRFQYISYSLSALKKIAGRYPEIKPYIKKCLHQKIREGALINIITLKANPVVKYNMSEKLERFIVAGF